VLLVLVILFTFLPYLAGPGACSYPTIRSEIGVLEEFFGGNCNAVEYVSIIFARIFWCGFAAVLFVFRRRLAERLGIREGVCPALCGHVLCCYACLLLTELRTVRDAREARNKEARSQGPAVIGDTVRIRAV